MAAYPEDWEVLALSRRSSNRSAGDIFPRDFTGRLYTYDIELEPCAITAQAALHLTECPRAAWVFGRVSRGQGPPAESSLTGQRLGLDACEGSSWQVATLLPFSTGPGARRHYMPVELSNGRIIWPHRFAVDYLDTRASSLGHHTATVQYFCWSPDTSLHVHGSLEDAAWSGPRAYHVVQDRILLHLDTEEQVMRYQVIGNDTSERSRWFQRDRQLYKVERTDCRMERTGYCRTAGSGLFSLWSDQLDAAESNLSLFSTQTITVHHFVPDRRRMLEGTR